MSIAFEEPVNLFAQQEANRRRSRWLVIGFVLFFAWLGFGGDWILWQATLGAADGAYRHVFPWGGLALSALAIGITWFAWSSGAEKVLWSAGASELTLATTPEERQLENVVEEMAIASGLPKPRIYLIADPDPNALATGRDPQSARIAVTTGLLQALDRDELQAVIAHEMGHVKNHDMQLMTLLAGMVGAVALIADGMGRVMRGTSRVRLGGSSRGGGKKGGGLGPVVLVVLVLWLVSWMLAPLVTRLLALGVSRKREYLADAMAAQFTRNPAALARALEKIEHSHAPTTSIKGGSAHLCIVDPLGRRLSSREGRLADLLATHPPMSIRIARLRAMSYQAMKRDGTFPAPDFASASRPVPRA